MSREEPVHVFKELTRRNYERFRPRWKTRKTLNLPLPGTAKLQLKSTTIGLKDKNLLEKIENKDIKKERQGDMEEGQRCGQVRTHTSKLETGGLSQPRRSFHRGVQALHQAPQPGDLAKGLGIPRESDFEGHGDLIA